MLTRRLLIHSDKGRRRVYRYGPRRRKAAASIKIIKFPMADSRNLCQNRIKNDMDSVHLACSPEEEKITLLYLKIVPKRLRNARSSSYSSQNEQISCCSPNPHQDRLKRTTQTRMPVIAPTEKPNTGEQREGELERREGRRNENDCPLLLPFCPLRRRERRQVRSRDALSRPYSTARDAMPLSTSNP